MFSKPLSLALVYLLSIVNFTILLLPFLIIIIPFIGLSGAQFYGDLYSILALIMFATSLLMIIYMFFDSIFGLSVRHLLKDCKDYSKEYGALKEIFEETKKRFNQPKVKLYVENSTQINAFAVGSLNSKNIILTEGIIAHFINNAESTEDALYGLRGVLGHEMSHLINKDFLPGLILNINERATNLISRFIYQFFRFAVFFMRFTPIIGGFARSILIKIYNLCDSLIHFFHRVIILNIYKFISKHISRSTEYRCDRQSAHAFGGENMKFALSFLGSSGYFTLFSTHPNTKSRMKKVANVQEKAKTISAPLINQLSNFIAIFALLVFCIYVGEQAQIEQLADKYEHNMSVIFRFIADVERQVSSIYRQILTLIK